MKDIVKDIIMGWGMKRGFTNMTDVHTFAIGAMYLIWTSVVLLGDKFI